MDLLDVGQVTRLRDPVPERDEHLASELVREASNALRLLLAPLVVLAVCSQSLDHRALVRRVHLLHSVLHLFPTLEDVFSSDHQLVALDESGESDRRLRTHEALSHRVETSGAFLTSDPVFLRRPPHVSEGVSQSVPRRRVRADRTRLNRSHINSEVVRVLTDEVDDDLVNLTLCPLKPVSVGRLQIDRPETSKKSRVHVIHIVLSAGIHSGEDASLWVESVWVTVLVVTKLAVKDQLERRLLDARQSAVHLVKHQNHRLLRSSDEPRWHTERHDARFLHAFDVRVTTNVTLTHRGESNVNEREANLVGRRTCEVGFTNTCRATHKHGNLCGKL